MLNDNCEGRPCLLEVRHPKAGWVSAMYSNRERTNPRVYRCSCEASQTVFHIGISVLAAMLAGEKIEFLPGPDDFRLQFVDEDALPPEIEVESIDDAEQVLCKFRGAK